MLIHEAAIHEAAGYPTLALGDLLFVVRLEQCHLHPGGIPLTSGEARQLVDSPGVDVDGLGTLDTGTSDSSRRGRSVPCEED